MRDDVRSYGDFYRLPPEAFARIRDAIPYPQVDYRDGVLRVDHEGKFIDIDDFLKEIAGLLEPGGWGKVDFIDHLDQKLTRYDIRDGRITSRTIEFNQATGSPIGTANL